MKPNLTIVVTIVSILVFVTIAVATFFLLTPVPTKNVSQESLQKFSTNLTVSIEGDAVAGNTLTASVNTITPAPQKIIYTWTVNNEITDYVGVQFFLTEEHIEAVINVTATIQKPGYASISAASAPTSPVKPKPISSEDLKVKIINLLNQYDGSYSLTLIELDGLQRSLNINGTRQVDPASTIKTFYAYYILKKAQEGKIDLNTKLSNGLTYQQCINLSLYVSDNGCAVELRLAAPMSSLNQMFQTEGYSNTRLILNSQGGYVTKTTTTNDLALLLQRLAEGKLLNEDYTKLLKSPLYNQAWLSKIPSGIPENITTFNKTGSLNTSSGLIEADTAIVYGPESKYVLTILGTDDAEADAIKAVSALIYQELQQDKTAPKVWGLQQFETIRPTIWRGANSSVTLPTGTQLELYYSEGTQFSVYYNNQLGWVDSANLSFNSEYTKAALDELR